MCWNDENRRLSGIFLDQRRTPPVMNMIRVAVSGAAGRMGRASIRAIAREPDMVLVGALERDQAIGQDAGEQAGAGRLDVTVTDSLEAVIAAGPDVLVEFAPGKVAADHAHAALQAGIRPVVGSTGIPQEEIERLRDLAARRRIGAVIAPNFAIGAVLMIEFARLAARHLPQVEIIELHHDRKRDAPSGTAEKTARAIATVRAESPTTDFPAADASGEELVAGARGGVIEGVRVHSVRLPGLVAHQEVVFGGPGQVLTIRHDSISEQSFMPGLLLAVRRVSGLNCLVYGLEHLLGLR